MLPRQFIVATTLGQIEYLDRLHVNLQDPVLNSPAYSPSGAGVPTYFLAPDEARDMEPDLGSNVKCALLSTESGIIDSHALMSSLEGEILADAGGDDGSGSVVLNSKVVRIDPSPSNGIPPHANEPLLPLNHCRSLLQTAG